MTRLHWIAFFTRLSRDTGEPLWCRFAKQRLLTRFTDRSMLWVTSTTLMLAQGRPRSLAVRLEKRIADRLDWQWQALEDVAERQVLAMRRAEGMMVEKRPRLARAVARRPALEPRAEVQRTEDLPSPVEPKHEVSADDMSGAKDGPAPGDGHSPTSGEGSPA